MAGPSGPAFLFNFYPRSPCGERHFRRAIKRAICNFYPRSPCGERHLRVLDGSKSSIISIHALLAESDLTSVVNSAGTTGFLSTLSLRRATTALLIQPTRRLDFYPRSPCGERRNLGQQNPEPGEFLSTLSLRRATRKVPILGIK